MTSSAGAGESPDYQRESAAMVDAVRTATRLIRTLGPLVSELQSLQQSLARFDMGAALPGTRPETSGTSPAVRPAAAPAAASPMVQPVVSFPAGRPEARAGDGPQSIPNAVETASGGAVSRASSAGVQQGQATTPAPMDISGAAPPTPAASPSNGTPAREPEPAAPPSPAGNGEDGGVSDSGVAGPIPRADTAPSMISRPPEAANGVRRGPESEAPAGPKTVSVAVSRTEGPLDLVRVHSALEGIEGVTGLALTSYTRGRAAILLETSRPARDLPLREALLAVFPEGVIGRWQGDGEYVAVIGDSNAG